MPVKVLCVRVLSMRVMTTLDLRLLQHAKVGALRMETTGSTNVIGHKCVMAAPNVQVGVHNDYIKKMGAAAVAAAKVKSASKKKQSAKKKEAVIKSCKLKVGMRVTAKWVDDDDDADDANDDCYYDGVVVSINYDNKTANILFDDGDTDDAVPWDDTRIQEDLSEDEDDG